MTAVDPGAGTQATALFVCGASRSGTSLLRSVLNRHPDVFVAGETHYFDDLRLRLPQHGTTPLSGEARRVCEDYFLALGHRPYGHGGDAASSRLDRAALRAKADAAGGDGDAYFEAYCKVARVLEPDASKHAAVWGEKTPRHVFRLPEILTRYPEAVAVCIYRDPRAVVASYRDWRNQGGFDLDADEGHREALQDEQRRTTASYDPAIASLLWRATVAAGRRAQEGFGSERVILVRYEDLVAEPEATVRDLTERLGLEYRDAMLEVPMHNSSFTTFARTAGVSSEPANRWRSVLSAREVATVQLWCRREMEHLGYELEPGILSRRDRFLMLWEVPVAAARALRANRHRMGSLGRYVWRRATLVLRHR